MDTNEIHSHVQYYELEINLYSMDSTLLDKDLESDVSGWSETKQMKRICRDMNAHSNCSMKTDRKHFCNLSFTKTI